MICARDAMCSAKTTIIKHAELGELLYGRLQVSKYSIFDHMDSSSLKWPSIFSIAHSLKNADKDV